MLIRSASKQFCSRIKVCFVCLSRLVSLWRCSDGVGLFRLKAVMIKGGGAIMFMTQSVIWYSVGCKCSQIRLL